MIFDSESNEDQISIILYEIVIDFLFIFIIIVIRARRLLAKDIGGHFFKKKIFSYNLFNLNWNCNK